MSDTPTDNHDFERPPDHEPNWGESLRNNWSDADDRIIIRDVESDVDNYTPKDGATFIATDTGAVYDGNGNQWILADRTVKSIKATSQATVDGKTRHLNSGTHIGSTTVTAAAMVALLEATGKDWQVEDSGGVRFQAKSDGGLNVRAQDLSALSLGSTDDGDLYRHDGSASITLHDGTTTSSEGYYVWDNGNSGWRQMQVF